MLENRHFNEFSSLKKNILSRIIYDKNVLNCNTRLEK